MPYLEEIKSGLKMLKPELAAKFHVNAIACSAPLSAAIFRPPQATSTSLLTSHSR
ncbi:MAG: hypothetical protein LBG47_09895 [Prevotellaceae bacterium]|jgi:hypothetical protein|nr:hypothetical protein [Prevotellaceae bacterium]